MNVIIKNMNMPKSCSKCPISHCKYIYDEQKFYCPIIKEFDDEDICKKHRMKSCPLIEAESREAEASMNKRKTCAFIAFEGKGAWVCGNCNHEIFHPSGIKEDEKKNHKYCSYCGMKIKWS